MERTNGFASYPSLRDRVIIVTGGATGIGEAIVEAFAMQNVQVAFLDVQDDAAEQLIKRLKLVGATVPAYYHCDLTDIGEVQHTVQVILDRFHTVDVLVNNAGNDTRHKTMEVTSEYWDQVIRRQSEASVLHGSSCHSLDAESAARLDHQCEFDCMGNSLDNQVVYITAKAGIVGMTRTLSRELGAHNIRANCIMPGAILTEHQQRLWLTEEYKAEILANQAMKRMILPEEVARLILFLASDDSSAITNQSYVIDAGWV